MKRYMRRRGLLVCIGMGDEKNRLDFENEWQMHKGIGYFAKKAVDNFLAKNIA